MLFSDYLKKINTQFYTALNSAEKVESAQIGAFEEYDEIYLFQDALILDERSSYGFERNAGIDTDMDADGPYIFRFEGYVAYTNDIEGVQDCIDYYNNESESIFEEGEELDEEAEVEELSEGFTVREDKGKYGVFTYDPDGYMLPDTAYFVMKSDAIQFAKVVTNTIRRSGGSNRASKVVVCGRDEYGDWDEEVTFYETIFENSTNNTKGNKLSEAYSDYDDEEEDTINVFFGYDVLADEVVAIFPDEIADYKGNITCYTHNGQHSACSKEYAKELKPASGNEYRPLYKELIGQGYSKLNILKKLSIR